MKISLLCPTRNRPSNLVRLVKSVLENASDPSNIEFVFYVDNDAVETSMPPELEGNKNIKWIIGSRVVLSEMWNMCYIDATGDILMHCGDDLVFQSKDWDLKVISAFEAYPDRIVFVHGQDGYWGERFGTHGFIHRRWVETVGYFVPPYFSSDWNDTWLNDVANALGRRTYLPDVFTEHMHYVFGKAERDETHADREARGQRDGVDKLYEDKKPQRIEDIAELRAVIEQKVYDQSYFKRDVGEKTFFDRGFLRPDQWYAIYYALGFTSTFKRIDRDPKKILSIGCGRGELEHELVNRGFDVVGADIEDFREYKDFSFIRARMGELSFAGYDTIIMCESLEHIPPQEFNEAYGAMTVDLKRVRGMLVITNWEDVFPIETNGVDHVMRVDRELFDRMSAYAQSVPVRKGSHLVLQF